MSKTLDDLRRLDAEELSNDEERVQLMCESSINGLENEIRVAKERVGERREEQRVLDARLDEQSRAMAQLLVELEQAENQRRIDENKIFQCKQTIYQNKPEILNFCFCLKVSYKLRRKSRTISNV